MNAAVAVPHPLRRRQRWWAQWWDARHPHTDSLALTQRNVYILPTRAGWVFGLTLAVLLIASINYQLSLGYLLTFLLAGSAVVSMHVTHATLRGLGLHLRPLQPVFAGESWTIECVLADGPKRRGMPRHGVRLHWRGQPDTGVWMDVPAGGQATLHLALPAERRGRHALGALTIDTRFPLGLFHAWAEWRPASQALAYPSPERPAPTLPPARALPGPSGPRADEGDEPDGVRAYRSGDALRRVLWKKAARALETGELVVRDTAGTGRRELWLEPDLAGLAGREERLSRLTAWVIDCDRRGIAWGLRLPGFELAPGRGDEHRRASLEALALSAA